MNKMVTMTALAVLSVGQVVAQGKSSVEVSLAEQGKPVSGALVVLQRIKNQKCAKFFSSQDVSERARKKAESCLADLPDGNTDASGKYAYSQLEPGWYDVRLLWSMVNAPSPRKAITCKGEDWGLFYEPGRDRTGKYDAMAQGMPFEVKAGESRQISFDYRNQFESPNCQHRFADVTSRARTGLARISVPGKAGVLELDPGPTTWQTELRNQGSEIYLQAMNRRDHLLVTAFLTEVSYAATPEQCRNERWRNEEKALRSHHIDPGHVKKNMQNGMALVEFLIDENAKGKLGMQDVHAYLGSGGLCAEVHLSKVYFQAEDRKLFDEVLSSVRFLPDEKVEQQ